MPNSNLLIKSSLKAYRPFNEQEEKDKTQMLNFVKKFDDVTTRNNTFGHFTASAFILNKEHNKMLVVEHKLFSAWIYPGGHADGEANLLNVAMREAEEETGIQPKVLDKTYYGIQSLPIAGHIKHGTYVSAHSHFDVIFLMEADEKEILTYREDESNGIKWINLNEATDNSIWEPVRPIHRKLIEKLNS